MLKDGWTQLNSITAADAYVFDFAIIIVLLLLIDDVQITTEKTHKQLSVEGYWRQMADADVGKNW